jgi:hexulose-6-phosphate isomerase
MKSSLGFIQGRLSPIVDGKIQAFPWNNWKSEFKTAFLNNFRLIEWTLDQDQLYNNPLMTSEGQTLIKKLCNKYKISIPSLTGDCFMQYPFFKFDSNKKQKLLTDLRNIISSCSILKIKYIVFPLVDNGSIENDEQFSTLHSELKKIEFFLEEKKVKIIFESDLPPRELNNFIEKFSPKNFGINYDIGNSASLGFNYKEELQLYGNRIQNVHVKDRLLHGSTVPLGEGNANIPNILKGFVKMGYTGNYILQTARSKHKHAEVLCKYKDYVLNYI